LFKARRPVKNLYNLGNVVKRESLVKEEENNQVKDYRENDGGSHK